MFAVAAVSRATGGLLDQQGRIITNYDEARPSRVLHAKDGIEPHVSFVKTEDGIALRCAAFYPEGEPKGTILLKPGKSGCVEDFQNMANAFVKDGYQVVCADPRGMGLSGRELEDTQKVHVDDFATYVKDDAQVLKKLVRPLHKNGSLLLVCHSMSGHSAVRGLADKAYNIDGVVAMAPMLEANGLKLDGTDRAVRDGIKSGTKTFWRNTNYFASLIAGEKRDFNALGTPEANDYTNNPEGFKEFVTRWQEEPRLVTGNVTTAWVDAYYKSADKLLALKDGTIETPTLFVMAKEDTIISNERIKSMASKFKNATQTTIDEKHDVEMGKKETLETVVSMTNAWVVANSLAPQTRAKLSSTRSGPAPAKTCG